MSHIIFTACIIHHEIRHDFLIGQGEMLKSSIACGANMEFSVQEDLVPLLVAVFLGAIVGLERQLRGHGAGLRTHIMVSLASAIFVIASRDITKANPVEITRVIQGIAAGVGFIGAGTILKLSSQHEVLGLTTASTIWLAAAVGTACGLTEYFLAGSGASLAVVFLIVLRPIEDRYGYKAKSRKERVDTIDEKS